MLSLVTSLLGCSEYSLNLTKEDTASPETAPPIPVEIPYSFSEMIAPCNVDYTLCGIDSATGLYQADCSGFIDSFLAAANVAVEGSDHTILVIDGDAPDAVDNPLELSAIIYISGDYQELFRSVTAYSDPHWLFIERYLSGYPENNGINDLPLDVCASETQSSAPYYDTPKLNFSSGNGLPGGFFDTPPVEVNQNCNETGASLGYSNTGSNFVTSNCFQDEGCISTAACDVYEQKTTDIEYLTSALVNEEFAGETIYHDEYGTPFEVIMFAGVYYCNESGECSGY